MIAADRSPTPMEWALAAGPKLLAALVAALLLAAAPAHADTPNERTFVKDVRATGWVPPGITDAQIVATGWKTCGALTNSPIADVVNQLTQNGVPPAQAQTAVNLSIKDLCPGSGS